jgi:hypothetical protein
MSFTSEDYIRLVRTSKSAFATDSDQTQLPRMSQVIAMAYYDIVESIQECDIKTDTALLQSLLEYFLTHHLVVTQNSAIDHSNNQKSVLIKVLEESILAKTLRQEILTELDDRITSEINVLAKTKAWLAVIIDNLKVWSDATPNADGSQPHMIFSKLRG